tara:strand:+ start:210 stop:965 length:756 start_codon:yes stop_codon:yes gene_type:complete
MTSPLVVFDNVSLELPDPEAKGFNIRKFLIQFASLKFQSCHKTKLLNSLNLSIYPGEKIGLIGPNGAGKTTFIRMLSSIFLPTSGEMVGKSFYPIIDRSLLVSHDLSAEYAIKAHYIYYKSSHSLIDRFPSFNTYKSKVLEISGLSYALHKKIKYYSEGMKTRLVFGLYMSLPSQHLLAIDEGFATGDKNFTSYVQQILKDYISSAGALVLASHSDNLLQEFCTRGLVFNNGSILFDGHIDDALNFYNQNL